MNATLLVVPARTTSTSATSAPVAVVVRPVVVGTTRCRIRSVTGLNADTAIVVAVGRYWLSVCGSLAMNTVPSGAAALKYAACPGRNAQSSTALAAKVSPLGVRCASRRPPKVPAAPYSATSGELVSARAGGVTARTVSSAASAAERSRARRCCARPGRMVSGERDTARGEEANRGIGTPRLAPKRCPRGVDA